MSIMQQRPSLTSGRKRVRDLLTHPSTYATSLLVLAVDRFGNDVFEWHPRTMHLEFLDDFGVEMSHNNLDKLMAAITIYTTDRFEKSLPSFVWICNVLADDDFDPTVFDVATAEEMAWGITEALLINPPEDNEHFCDEIRWYIGHMLDEEGVVDPPDVLRIGLHSREQDPLNTFSDDPEMYQSLFESQQQKSKDIAAVIRHNLRELFVQLESLPLDNGDVKELLNRVRELGHAT